MTENENSPENLRKFLESDDLAMVRMGLSMAKGADVEITIKDLERFLKSKDIEAVITGVMFAIEAGISNELISTRFPPYVRGLSYFLQWQCVNNSLDAWPDTISALRRIGNDGTTIFLIELLEYFAYLMDHEHYNSDVEKIIETLGNIGGEKAANAIADALTGIYDGEYYSHDSTDCAAAALTKIGEPAVGALMELVTMTDNEMSLDGEGGSPVSTLEIKENAARIIIDILGTRKASDLLLNVFALPVDEHGEECENEEYDWWDCVTCCALETCFCVVLTLSESEDKRFLESAEKLRKYIDADSQKELYSEPEDGYSNPFIYIGRHFDSYQKLLEMLE